MTIVPLTTDVPNNLNCYADLCSQVLMHTAKEYDHNDIKRCVKRHCRYKESLVSGKQRDFTLNCRYQLLIDTQAKYKAGYYV